jgi:hypothetical protein
VYAVAGGLVAYGAGLELGCVVVHHGGSLCGGAVGQLVVGLLVGRIATARQLSLAPTDDRCAAEG